MYYERTADDESFFPIVFTKIMNENNIRKSSDLYSYFRRFGGLELEASKYGANTKFNQVISERSRALSTSLSKFSLRWQFFRPPGWLEASYEQ